MSSSILQEQQQAYREGVCEVIVSLFCTAIYAVSLHWLKIQQQMLSLLPQLCQVYSFGRCERHCCSNKRFKYVLSVYYFSFAFFVERLCFYKVSRLSRLQNNYQNQQFFFFAILKAIFILLFSCLPYQLMGVFFLKNRNLFVFW